jgi:adenine phosphoribosyltransferase
MPSPIVLSDYIGTLLDFPKPGIVFRDVTPLLAAPTAFREAVDQLASAFAGERIDLVAAAEARGFIFAAPVALKLGAGLVPIRKPGKLPGACLSLSYELEYGTDTLEIRADAIPRGARVLVLDDLLATGGTIDACCRLVEKAGGQVAGCAFVIELLGCGGAKRIARYRTVSLIKYD